MKTIIAGSRTIADLKLIYDVIERSDIEITEVVCGMAKGVDTLGHVWADQNNIPVKCFPANWGKFGVAAGPIRNEQMAKYAEAAIIVWDGFSRGTQSMIKLVKKYGLSTRVYNQSKNTLDIYPIEIK